MRRTLLSLSRKLLDLATPTRVPPRALCTVVPPSTRDVTCAPVSKRPSLVAQSHATSMLSRCWAAGFGASGCIRRLTTDTFTESGKPALKPPLNKSQAQDLVFRLTPEERAALVTAIQEFQSEERRQYYQAQHVPAPSPRELGDLALHNAMPFIGFGFLDNFIMIIAGDYIDMTIGAGLGISTMAAAALGNTISDVAGIGSAWYVENIAVRIGVKVPEMSPMQLEMNSSRWAANLGRAFGVIIGCLLGMFPLLFLPAKEEEDESKDKDKEKEKTKR